MSGMATRAEQILATSKQIKDAREIEEAEAERLKVEQQRIEELAAEAVRERREKEMDTLCVNGISLGSLVSLFEELAQASQGSELKITRRPEKFSASVGLIPGEDNKWAAVTVEFQAVYEYETEVTREKVESFEQKVGLFRREKKEVRTRYTETIKEKKDPKISIRGFEINDREHLEELVAKCLADNSYDNYPPPYDPGDFSIREC